MRISDWSSDVCSSDLPVSFGGDRLQYRQCPANIFACARNALRQVDIAVDIALRLAIGGRHAGFDQLRRIGAALIAQRVETGGDEQGRRQRSEEHTSELQSLMRISYAVFCLKKKK